MLITNTRAAFDCIALNPNITNHMHSSKLTKLTNNDSSINERVLNETESLILNQYLVCFAKIRLFFHFLLRYAFSSYSNNVIVDWSNESLKVKFNLGKKATVVKNRWVWRQAVQSVEKTLIYIYCHISVCLAQCIRLFTCFINWVCFKPFCNINVNSLVCTVIQTTA